MMQLPLSLHACFRDCCVASCSGRQPCGQDVAEALHGTVSLDLLRTPPRGQRNCGVVFGASLFQQAASSRHLV